MSLTDPNVVNRKAPKRIAIVISNPAISTTTGWPVGFWWSEQAKDVPLRSFSVRDVEGNLVQFFGR